MKVFSGSSLRAWGMRYGVAFIMAAYYCLSVGPAWGGSVCDDTAIKSPDDLMKQAGVQNPENPCQEQNRVDKKYGDHGTCQENANQVKYKYATWLAKHKQTCDYYKSNIATLSQKCSTQDACYQQQQQVLSTANGYLQQEKSSIGDLTTQIEALAKNQIDTAQGAVKLQNEIENSPSESKPMGVDFLQKGYKNAGDAVSYFNGQDLAEANDLVQAMANGTQFQASSITAHAPNQLTNEPLLVAQAARDFNTQMASRTADINSLMSGYSTQQAAVAQSGTNLGTAASSPTADSTSTLPSANSLTNAAGAASSAAGAAGAVSGSGGSGSQLASIGGTAGAANSGNLAASAATAAGATAPTGAAFASNGVVGSTALAGTAAPGAVAAVTPGATAGGAAAVSSTGASGNLRALLATRLAGSSGAARSSASGGGSAAAVGGNNFAAGAKEAAARAPASIGVGADLVSGGDGPKMGDAETSFTPPLISVTSESNEGAVKALVGAWEKALHADSASAVQADLTGVEGEPLFGRVKLAHERALRRGAIVRTISGKL